MQTVMAISIVHPWWITDLKEAGDIEHVIYNEVREEVMVTHHVVQSPVSCSLLYSTHPCQGNCLSHPLLLAHSHPVLYVGYARESSFSAKSTFPDPLGEEAWGIPSDVAVLDEVKGDSERRECSSPESSGGSVLSGVDVVMELGKFSSLTLSFTSISLANLLISELFQQFSSFLF